MYGILVAAANYLLGFLLKGVVIKFVVLTAIFYVVTWVMESVFSTISKRPFDGLETIWSDLPGSMLYFLAVFRFDFGLPLIFTAYCSAFIIRRLPFIG